MLTRSYPKCPLVVCSCSCACSCQQIVELSGLEDGVLELEDIQRYFTNLWNLMDWGNYLVFFKSFIDFRLAFSMHAAQTPCSTICEATGYQDEWEL